MRPEEAAVIKDAMLSGTAKLSKIKLNFFPVDVNAPVKKKVVHSVSNSEDEFEEDSTFSNASTVSMNDSSDEDDDFELEPVDCLHQMIDNIKTNNVLVVPCDLLTSFNLSELFYAHQFGLEHSAMTALFNSYPDGLSEALCPGQSRKLAADFPLVTVTAETSKILHYLPPGDVQAGDELRIPHRVLSVAGAFNSTATPIRLLSRMSDSHVYIFRTSILDRILRASDRHLHASIRDDLIPFTIDQQTLPERRRSVTMADFGLDEMTREAMSWLQQHVGPKSTAGFFEKKTEKFGANSAIKCYGFLAPNSTFAIRVNTVANFVLASLNLSRFWSSFAISQATNTGIGSKETANASISSKARVANDVLIGSGCVVGERAVVNRCVMGKHCRIADDAKVTDSVLFDNVEIGPGCVVQNSVVCGHSVLEEKSEVRESIVVEKHVVPKGSTFESFVFSILFMF